MYQSSLTHGRGKNYFFRKSNAFEKKKSKCISISILIFVIFSCCKIHSPVHFNLTFFAWIRRDESRKRRNEDKTLRSDALLLLLSFKSLNSHTQKGGIALTMDTFASKQEAKRGQIPSMHFKALTQSLFLAEKNVSLHKVR